MTAHTLSRVRSHGLLLSALTLALPIVVALALPASIPYLVPVAVVLPFLTMSTLERELPHGAAA